MSSIQRPRRIFSFSDWNISRPKDPPPGDVIDAQLNLLIDAITSTQDALAQIRRDDGKIKNHLIGPEQLTPGLADTLSDMVEERIAIVRTIAAQATASVINNERNTELFAKDAEKAAISSLQTLSETAHALDNIRRLNHEVAQRAEVIENEASDAENWANYSKAQADNAIAAKDEALQWAEFLAGPVVDAAAAPAYIAGSKFPHGLYYQPVNGGLGGLWSAKWWAIWAQQIVGPWAFYYLGAWPSPPIPGAISPTTGQQIPNPIAPGSLYYNSSTGQLMLWNGTMWISPLTLAAGVQKQFTYIATAGQTVFSGNDHFGQVPVVGESPSEVHQNGLLLIEGVDYEIDAGSNELQLLAPADAGDVVHWDLLVPPQDLAPGIINAFKVTLAETPDGATTAFHMTFVDPIDGIEPVDVTDGWQLQVSLDGIVQEPGVEYVALDDVLTMTVAPPADSRLWVVWFKAVDMVAASGVPEAPNDGKQYGRQSEMWTEVAMDGGVY